MIVLGLILYFVVNSPLVIRKLANIYAPDYNISYSRIYGNVITGVEVEDLAYKNEALAKYIALKWNPSGLFMKKIIINTLKIEKANVDTIKTLVKSFENNENNENNESDGSKSIDIGVTVHYASVDIDPFVEKGIGVSDLALKAQNVRYTSDSVNVANLDLKVDSNVTDIDLHASLKKGKVLVEELTLNNVDTLALQRLFLPDTNESKKSDVVVMEEDNASQAKPVDPLIPKWVYIDKLEVNILPIVYQPVDIKQLNLSGSNAVFDVQKLLLKKANLELKSSTNLSDIHYKTRVKNNKLIGKVDFKPKKALFELYELPLRQEAIGNIVLDLNVSEKQVVTDLQIKMEQVLKDNKDDFNLDIDNLETHVVYDIKKGSVNADSKVLFTTPYAKNVLVTNIFTMDEQIRYSGEIHAEQFIGVDAKFVKPLNNLQIIYEGDSQSLNTDIESDKLQGTVISSDFKKADLHLESKEALALNEFMELPEELNQTKANFIIDALIHFDTNTSLLAQTKISSNVVNVDANISYQDVLKIDTVTVIPNESLLRTYIEDLKWDSLNPIKMETVLKDDAVDSVLSAGTLAAKAHYDLESKKVDGELALAGLRADISGAADQNLSIDTHINSISSLIDSVNSIYTLGDVPVLKGSADISIKISELKYMDMMLRSPEIIYHVDHKTVHPVNDIDLVIRLEESGILLKRYTFTFETQKLFATKPSTFSLKDEILSISPLWINDQLQITGEYNIKTKKGNIDADAKNLHTEHQLVDLDSKIDIKAVLDTNETDVHGEVILLGGRIHYDTSQKSFASDSDIIIVQDIKKKDESSFMNTLSTSIHIKTENPLIYNEGEVDTKANVDLVVYKVKHGELVLLGTLELLAGGSYTIHGKRFVLDKSYVYFTGKPDRPLIDASVKYKSARHLITITVTGTADTPKIEFSSKPSLTKEQILSVILFDSEGGSKANDADNMMKMMGGTIARTALSDMGIKFDHLTLTDKGLEVGKQLTDKILALLNTVASAVKLKYIHTENIESVMSFGAESQSYDIIYRREF
jgi:translocation and assembly module TamB